MGGCCGGRSRPARTTTGRAGDSTVVADRSYLRFFVGDDGYDTLAEAREAAEAAGTVMEMRRVPR